MSNFRFLLTISGSCTSLAFANCAHAQEAVPPSAPTTETPPQDSGSDVPDIVVTATKMGATSLQRTPLAISAVTSDSLKATGSVDLRDLSRVATGLTVSENSGWSQVYLRGIGSSNVFGGSEASVATLIDGVYLGRPSSAFSDFLDIDRVEVLRGPQGTLYGRNAAGGVINVITETPGNALRAKGLLSYGKYNDVKVEGSVSGPLVTDVLQASVSGLYARHDAYIDNLYPGGVGLNSRDDRAFRGKLRYLPADGIELMLAADYSLQKGVPWGSGKPITINTGYSPIIIADPWTVSVNSQPFGRNRQYGFSGTARIDLGGGFNLTSITAYRNTKYEIGGDSDNTELPIRYSIIREAQHQFSEDAQLNYSDQRLKTVLGFYYFTEHVSDDFDIRILPSLSSRTFAATDTYAYAGYGQADFKLSPLVGLTAGIRYSYERKLFNRYAGLAPLGGLPTTGVVNFGDRNTFESLTPKFGINLTPASNLLFYGSVTKGFKSGGFNTGSTAPGRGFAPETVWAYELGSKVDLFDRKVRLAASAFYYDYSNLQVQTFVAAGVLDISNAANARIKGVELEGTFAVAHGLTLGGNVAYLDANYRNYNAVISGALLNVNGNILNLAPRWKATAFVNYEAELGNGGTFFVNSQVSYQSRVFFRADNNPLLSQSGYAVLGGRVGYRVPDGRWEIAGYVKNATDKAYFTAADTISPVGFGGRTGDPRTYGLQLSFRY